MRSNQMKCSAKKLQSKLSELKKKKYSRLPWKLKLGACPDGGEKLKTWVKS